MQPLARPEHLQPRAVDHHVDRAARLLQGRRDTQVGAAAREGRMIRHRQIQAEQVHDRTQHAFGLTPRPTERQPQHQPRFDRDVRIVSCGRPRRPVAAGTQAAIASGVTQTVRLPRRRSAASYSAQFSILYRAFGIL